MHGWRLLVFVLALSTRLAHLYALSRQPFYEVLFGDGLSYHRWAQEIARGDWLGSEVFYQAPLYPYFLGSTYHLLGEGRWVIGVVQSVLGALACVLVASAAGRFFSRPVGIVAGVVLALYAPAIFYGGLVQKTVLGLFLLACLLWALSRSLGGDWRWALATGVALGGLVLTRENSVVLAAPILLGLLLGMKSGAGAFRVAAFGLGLALTLAPVAARNYSVSGELHVTTSQLGPNLYIGNNPHADGTYQPIRPGRQDPLFEREDARSFAEERVGRALSPAEVNGFYLREVARYVREEPASWAALMLRKLALTWNATEIVDAADQQTYASWSPVLRWAGVFGHFGVLAVLGLAGGVLAWDRRSEIWILYALTATYAASVVAFYVFGRYRFPLAPLLAIFAAVAIVEGPRRAREAGRAPRVAAVLALVAAGVVVHWPLVDPGQMRALTHYNLGQALDLDGRAEDAVAQYRLAIAADPAFPEARNKLGVALARREQYELAIRQFTAALEHEPGLAEAHNNLGTIRLRRGELEAAARHFRAAVDADPDDAQAHLNLGAVLFESRDLDGARAAYARALELDPGQAQVHNNLGIIAAIEGDLDVAAEHFENALSIDPNYEEARENLGRALGGPP